MTRLALSAAALAAAFAGGCIPPSCREEARLYFERKHPNSGVWSEGCSRVGDYPRYVCSVSWWMPDGMSRTWGLYECEAWRP